MKTHDMSPSTKRATRVGGAALAAALGLAACATPQAAAPTTAALPMPPPAPTPAPVIGKAPALLVPAAPPPPPAPPPAAPERATPDAPFRANAPAPGAEAQFKVPAFKRFKLKNGLEVILAEFHDLPLIDVNLVIKAGGGANPPELAGLAEMTANMLDEGTKTRSALEIADEMAVLGANLATASSWDASNASMSVLTKNLDAALAVWADVVQHPAFSEQEFTRVRDNLLTAIARRKDSPPVIATLAMSKILYGDKHPFAWPMTGVETSLKKLTVGELRKFYDAYYRPNNAVLIVAGDITEAALRPKLENALKSWKSGAVPKRKLPAPPVATRTKVYLIDKGEAPQSSIRVGLVGIERTNPDYIPVTVMNLILGGGFYRLDLNLREGKGWTYGARSTFDARRTPGPFSAGGEFVATHTADSVAEILKEVNTIRETDVSDAELARAKDQIIKSFPARFATRGSTAGQLADLAIYGLPDSYLKDYTKKIAAITKEDVHKMARKYLTADKLSIVVVGDQKVLKDGLSKIAPVELRDLEGNLLPVPVASETGAKGGAEGGKSEE
jgi:predicted Zn-dependent peptidase